MGDWHPFRLADPVEWYIRYPVSVPPIGVVRRLEFGIKPDVWFRAVTWSEESARRRLLGYFATPEDAAAAVWQAYLVESRAQHEQAAKRADRLRATNPPPSLPPERGVLLSDSRDYALTTMTRLHLPEDAP